MPTAKSMKPISTILSFTYFSSIVANGEVRPCKLGFTKPLVISEALKELGGKGFMC